MKKARILFIMLFLLTSSMAFAQMANSTNAIANKSWQTYWRQFSVAVNKKDRVALKRLMSSEKDFDGIEPKTRDAWIRFVDESKLWGELQRSVGLGTVPYYEGKRPGRITKNRNLIFQFIGGRWRFVGVMGD
jgi:hypothetical protein